MEGQNTQSLETLEDFNQNSAGIHPGKVDAIDPSNNGILTYVDHAEDEGAGVPDLLRPEKQVFETSSVTDMTISTSQDTGFGSASVSEISSPVENNYISDKALGDTAAVESESEHYDNTLSNEINENNENISNNKVKDENVLSAALKVAEAEHIEKIPSYKDRDDNSESAAQKETVDKNFESAAHKEIADNKFEDSAHKEMIDKIFESAADKDTINNNIETALSEKTEDTNIEKQSNDKAESENAAYKIVKNEDTTEVENVVSAEEKQAQDEDFISAAHKQVGDELVETIVNDKVEETVNNKGNEETKDENVEKREIDKVEGANIENATNEEEPETVQSIDHEKVENSNVVKAANYITGNESATNEKQNYVDNDNVESSEDKQTKDKDVQESENDNAEDQDVKIVSNKAEDGNDDATLEKFEKVLNEQAGDDDTVEDASNKDKHIEGLTSEHVNDKNLENAKSDIPKDETIEKAANDKAEDEQITSDTAKDEKAAGDEKENVIDILGNGLLKKKVLVPGKGFHTRPNNGDIVTLKVDGQLPDGTHIDTGEITFNLHDGDVILAFELAAALMEVGEQCELFTSERYAYGSLGRDPDVPKDASITYILELVNVQKAPDVSEISFDQRLKMGEAKRERGNYLFGRTDYSGAINSYNKAVKLLDDPELNEGIDESSCATLTESWVKCYNNLAACQLKINALDAAIKSCEKVLSAQEDNVKALFRLGKAYGAKGEVDHAIAYLRRAIRLDPESKLMQQEMLNLTRLKSKETATEKALYQRMLGVKPGEKSPTMDEDKRKGNSNRLVKWTLVAGGIAAVLISVGLNWYRSS